MTAAGNDGGGSVSGDTALLAMRGIRKSFGGVAALSDVDFEANQGECHAVVGENGAGKSTLMKILAGAYQPDEGTILIDGAQVGFRDPRDAQRQGVSIIYQEFNLLPDRTVAENIFLGREPRRRLLIDRRAMEEHTQELFAMLDLESFSARTPVRELSVAEQQMVEIAKALSFDAKIVIMDEPTAPLSPSEVGRLYERVERLQDRGITVLYVSHRLEEIFRLADRVTVLKDGHKVGTVPTADVSSEDLVRMMVGRDLDHYFPPRGADEDFGDVALRVRGGAVGMLHDVDLEVRAGEVVGLAGLQGAGRTEVLRAVFGVTPFERGTVELYGTPRRIGSPREAVAARLGYVSEDRKAEGLVLLHSVRDNMLLPLRGAPEDGKVDRSQVVDEVSDSVDLRVASLDTEVGNASGGNQQKVVLGKWLARGVDILLLDEPTRGIDVGAKAGIHDVIRGLAREGLAILMVSSELPEVIGMSDRILVMRRGTIAGELPAGSPEPDIMLLATGQSSDDRHREAPHG